MLVLRMGVCFFLAVFFLSARLGSAADNPDDSLAMEKLQEVQELVGEWNGLGTVGRNKTWDENLDCQWDLSGAQPSLQLAIDAGEKKEGPYFEQASLSYDPEGKEYVLTARLWGSEETLEFRGKAKTKSNLVLDRADKGKAKDDLDRVDLKILNDGDRLVYSLHRRIGKSKNFRQLAQIGLNRQGTSLAAANAGGPKCIVTGGAGTMTVSYNGATYYVCCSGCRAAFEDDPEKYIARAAKKP
jgi:YHS domain-containing protein